MRAVAAVLLALAVPATAADTVTFHVAPGGEDAADGSAARPFATVERALEAHRAHAAGAKATGRSILLAGGDYVLARPIVLDPKTVPADAPLVLGAADGAAPRLLGGRAVGGFAPPAEGDPLAARLDAAARPHVRVADLKARGVTDFGKLESRGFGRPSRPAALEVFVDGRPMTLATWPNDGWATSASVPSKQPVVDQAGIRRGMASDRFGYTGDRPKRWLDAADAWVHGYWTHDWADSYERVASIDPAARHIVTVPPHGVYGYRKGQRWRVLNVPEELDRPGEWYLDRATGRLYLWPPRPLEDADVVVSLMEEPLVALRGAQDVTLRGLRIEAGRGTGVTVINCRRCALERCTVANLGQWGVVIRGGSACALRACTLRDLGEGGAVLDGGDRRTLTPAGHEAADNSVRRFGRWCRTYRPAFRLAGVGQGLLHNLMEDAPHSAVLIDGNDHLIEANLLQRVCQDTGDVGAMYIGRDWTERGTVIRHNRFRDIGGVGMGSNAVYLDDCASGITVEGNLFEHVQRGMMIGGGRDNTVTGNVFIDCRLGVWIDARGIGWAKSRIVERRESWDLVGKLKRFDYAHPPWSTKYPRLATILDGGDPKEPRGNVVRGNAAVRCKLLDLKQGARAEWVDTADNEEVAGPGDVAITPTGITVGGRRLGVAPIPVDTIGPRE